MLSQFEKLIQWSNREYSELPWRHERTLYTTLVSEIMLQQTTVATVKPRFKSFLKTFPNLSCLASSSEKDLALAWQGLGYYRRAKNLFKAASYLHCDLKGKFPEREDELMQIPGIGDYTANALLAIGMNKPTLALDANIKRILCRYFAIDQEGKNLDIALKNLTPKFSQVFQKYGARKLNEALMDLGRTVCKARKADCLICPLYKTCLSGQRGDALSLPRKKTKSSQKETLDLVRFIVVEDKSILLYQKKKGEWLEGQWELPSAVLSTSDQNFKQYPNSFQFDLPQQSPLKTAITKYKINNYYHYVTLEQLISQIPFYQNRQCKFIPLSELEPSKSKEHLSTSTLKILRILYK